MPAMSASASIDIRSPLSRVHEVLTDFNSGRHGLPGCTRSRMQSSTLWVSRMNLVMATAGKVERSAKAPCRFSVAIVIRFIAY